MNLYVNGVATPHKTSAFKGGEVFFELGQTVTIECYLRSSNTRKRLKQTV